jgi:hypothetical protein
VEFISQFFGTIPDALRALWDIAEGFYGVAITLGSVVIAVGLGWLRRSCATATAGCRRRSG